jgi:chromosome segregation ATPase
LRNEAHNVLVDSERKLAVVEDETQRTDERLRSGTEHVSSLEGKINDVGGEIRVLEDRDNDAAEREELTEEKLKVRWRNQGRRNFVKIGGGGHAHDASPWLGEKMFEI